MSKLFEYLQIEQTRERFSAIPHLISLFSFNCSLLPGFLHCLQIADVDIASANKLELISLYPSANLLVIFHFPKVIVSDLVLPRKDCFFINKLFFNFSLLRLTIRLYFKYDDETTGLEVGEQLDIFSTTTLELEEDDEARIFSITDASGSVLSF